MADSEHSYVETHLPRELLHSSAEPKGKRSVDRVKSFTHFLGKFICFALLLIAIPLLPTQAPDFINQKIFTKFGEIVHLLFISVAVSYGLFCRRNDGMEVESHSSNSDDSMSYVSGVLHVSSIFEDGFYNSYGYNEKNMYAAWYYEKGSSVIADQNKPKSLNSEAQSGNPSGYGENYLSQAWNYSQYVQGESTVAAYQENCAVNEYVESKLMMGHKPLGLPVRSLRPGLQTQDGKQISDVSTMSSSISRDSSNSPTESVNNSCGELGPLNLESKFNYSGSAALLSPNHWRSIDRGMDMRENLGIASHPSHFKPHSLDETQFELLKSQSLGSIENLSSQITSMSDSPNRLSPARESLEMENLKKEGLGTEQIYHNSYPPATPVVNGKTSLNAFHIRRYTNGSLFAKNVRKSSEDDLKIRGESRIKDQLGNKDWISSSLKWNGNSAKTSSMGKSVRTFRSRKYEIVKAGEKSGNNISKGTGKPSQEIDAVWSRKSEMTLGGLDSLSAIARKQDVECHSRVPKPKRSEFQKWNDKKHSENVVESEETSEHKQADTFEVKSDEIVAEAEAEAEQNEVDKKAGEFIARFREQIRLQKMASTSRSRGPNHHHFR